MCGSTGDRSLLRGPPPVGSRDRPAASPAPSKACRRPAQKGVDCGGKVRLHFGSRLRRYRDGGFGKGGQLDAGVTGGPFEGRPSGLRVGAVQSHQDPCGPFNDSMRTRVIRRHQCCFQWCPEAKRRSDSSSPVLKSSKRMTLHDSEGENPRDLGSWYLPWAMRRLPPPSQPRTVVRRRSRNRRNTYGARRSAWRNSLGRRTAATGPQNCATRQPEPGSWPRLSARHGPRTTPARLPRTARETRSTANGRPGTATPPRRTAKRCDV